MNIYNIDNLESKKNDLEELKYFLNKFDLEENKINELLKNKEIKNLNNNLFLIEKQQISEINKNQISKGLLLFIDLISYLPSKYLLKYIYTNSKNHVLLRGEKQALNYTYGKDLAFESIRNMNQLRFKEDKYYLAIYEDKIFGYFKYDSKNKKHPLKNIMNIGQYLHEKEE